MHTKITLEILAFLINIKVCFIHNWLCFVFLEAYSLTIISIFLLCTHMLFFLLGSHCGYRNAKKNPSNHSSVVFSFYDIIRVMSVKIFMSFLVVSNSV